MPLPHFLIAGAQKAGTSWLARRMTDHPDVFMPPRELNFFSLDEHYLRGVDWYGRHFTGAQSGQLVSEKSPGYLYTFRQNEVVSVAQRVCETLPDVKIMFVLRDPVERAISSVFHHMYNRRFPPTASVSDVLFGRFSETARFWGILETGLYTCNLEPYFRAFGEDQIRIWIYEEDVVRAPEAMLSDAFEFIGLTTSHQVARAPIRPANVGVRSRLALRGNYYLPALSSLWQALDRALPGVLEIKADPNCLDRLRDYYDAENKRLSSRLGRPFPHWQCCP
jgi:hypothetical protein